MIKNKKMIIPWISTDFPYGFPSSKAQNVQAAGLRGVLRHGAAMEVLSPGVEAALVQLLQDVQVATVRRLQRSIRVM